MGSQQLDNNYKPISQNLYDPVAAQFVSPLAGLVKTGSDGTLYAPHIFAPSDGNKATYSAAKVGLVPGSSATDIFTLTGSATKIVRVTRIEIAGTSTSASGAALDVLLLKRSTANTLGTSTGSPTPVPHDSADAVATATVLAYTAVPTTGTLVGTAIRNQKLMLALATDTSSDFPPMDRIVWEFGNRPSKGLVLRGIGEVLAINLNAATPTATASFDIAIEWTEESLT